MDKHFAPIHGSYVLPFRTGYESMLPYKVGDKFCINALEDGVVTDVKDNVSITIKYKDEVKEYTLTSSKTRLIGGKHYVLRKATLLKKGDEVKVGYNITYDTSYFAQDLLNPRRVAYKGGILANIALEEGQDSFEDGSKVSKGFSKALSTSITYTKVEILDGTSDIISIRSIGDKIESGESFLVYTPHSDDDLSDSLQLLQELNRTSFNSEEKGTIVDIEVFYNGELANLSKSLQKIIKKTDVLMKQKTGYTGKVLLGYSESGKQINQGEVLIKISVEKTLPLGVIDKYVIGDQLKSTVSSIYENIETKSGRPVDLMFGVRSVAARKVHSPYKQGLVNMILEKMQNEIIKMNKG